jgi:hypothetical protein
MKFIAIPAGYVTPDHIIILIRNLKKVDAEQAKRLIVPTDLIPEFQFIEHRVIIGKMEGEIVGISNLGKRRPIVARYFRPGMIVAMYETADLELPSSPRSPADRRIKMKKM